MVVVSIWDVDLHGRNVFFWDSGLVITAVPNGISSLLDGSKEDVLKILLTSRHQCTFDVTKITRYIRIRISEVSHLQLCKPPKFA